MRSRLIPEPELEVYVEIESASAEFPHAVVDRRGQVYFDLATASEAIRQTLLRRARPGDRFVHASGRVYYSAPLLRRHLPPQALERFDVMVEVRQQQAGRAPEPPAPRRGLLGRLRRLVSAQSNERSESCR